MDTSDTELTVRVAGRAEIPPKVAVIVVWPEVTAVAFPPAPAIVAMEVAEELHVDDDVRS